MLLASGVVCAETLTIINMWTVTDHMGLYHVLGSSLPLLKTCLTGSRGILLFTTLITPPYSTYFPKGEGGRSMFREAA